MRQDNEEMNRTRIERERKAREAENFRQHSDWNAYQNMHHADLTIANE
jgi:hypothetical protein